MAKETLTVPDIGGAEDAEVIEIYVSAGDRVELEQSLLALESDKASMEIPADRTGTVVEVLVKEGDALAEGAAIVVIETDADTAGTPAPESAEAAPASQPAKADSEPEPAEVRPETGSAGTAPEPGPAGTAPESAPVGARPEPAPAEVRPEPGSAGAAPESAPAGARPESAPAEVRPEPGSAGATSEPGSAEAAPAPASSAPVAKSATAGGSSGVYAGPAVRKLAREFGVDLGAVSGSGPKGRVLKQDVQTYVKRSLQDGGAPASGAGIPSIPVPDFAAFGEVDIQPLTRMDKVTAANMRRNWLNVPHVTQFDEIDITELEAFRAGTKAEAERRGTKLTPLLFLLKACAVALRDNRRLNASLHADGEHIVYKQYVHIGVAVDTPAGLLVPVVRDVDRKGLWELAAETAELAARARDRKLRVDEMQGACFTVSSLGNIGGAGFTPIVNAPEVAILGVSKLAVKPVWNGTEFQPRKMLPLSLSYDHRVVNGADGGRFMRRLGDLLEDIRRLLL